MNNLKKIRKLYNYYSPLKSDKSLTSFYHTLFDNDIYNSIRQEYNDVITCSYLNEAVIKAAFVKQKLAPWRSSKYDTVIFELNSLNSRADLALINNFSRVYEIKTEYDDFSRLENQLKDYEKLFEYIYIIVPKSKVRSVKDFLSSKIGIISYEQTNIFNIFFKYEKEANFNNKINAYSQLITLTKKELLKLNNKANDYSLNKQILIKNLVSSLTDEKINMIYKRFLEKKYNYKWKFLYKNLDKIYKLDYQFFFKNNIDYKIIYK